MLVTQTSPRSDVPLPEPLLLSISPLCGPWCPLRLGLPTAYNLTLKHPDVVAGVNIRPALLVWSRHLLVREVGLLLRLTVLLLGLTLRNKPRAIPAFGHCHVSTGAIGRYKPCAVTTSGLCAATSILALCLLLTRIGQRPLLPSPFVWIHCVYSHYLVTLS